MSVGHCGNGCSRIGEPRYAEREDNVPNTDVPWSAWADIGNCADTGCFCAFVGPCAPAGFSTEEGWRLWTERHRPRSDQAAALEVAR